MGVISSDERKVGLHQWSEYLHKEVLTGINRRPPRHDTPFAFTRMVLTRTIVDRKSTRLNSSHGYISYAVFCLKKKNKYSAGVHVGRGERERSRGAGVL